MAHSKQGAPVFQTTDLTVRRFEPVAPCPVAPFTGDFTVSDNEDKILTYWLIPSEPARSYFRSLIGDLARRTDAPLFEPHVTLYVTSAAGEKPADVLQSALPDFKPFRLSVAGLDCSDKFTKTLYVQFQPDVALQRLSEKLRAASISQRDYELNPHLSLIYKTMAPEEKRQLMGSLDLAYTEADFDGVKAVLSPAKIESREDVEAWRMVASQQLSG
jgi:2'-5' RNA ligase